MSFFCNSQETKHSAEDGSPASGPLHNSGGLRSAPQDTMDHWGGAPAAHIPANTVHCWHFKTQVLDKHSCHAKDPKRKRRRWSLKKTKTAGWRVDARRGGCQQRWRKQRTEPFVFKKQMVRRDNAFVFPLGVYLAVCLQWYSSYTPATEIFIILLNISSCVC